MVFVNCLIDIFLAAVNCAVLHLIHLLELFGSGRFDGTLLTGKALPLRVQGIYKCSPPFPIRTD